MASIKLGTDWDLDVDGFGDIKTTESDIDERSQNVALACSVWLGESYWNTNFGVPYRNILGYRVPNSLITAYLIRTAMTVSGVENVRIVLNDIDSERTKRGSIIVNEVENVNF